MDDGERFTDSAWVEGVDYLEAAEKARRNRQWDLRDLMRRAEFTEPMNVRYAGFEAKKYNVRPREIIAFEMTKDGIDNIQYAPGGMIRELPGATREDIDRLPGSEPDWRDVQEAGYGFAR